MKRYFRKLWRMLFPQYMLYVHHRGKDRTIHVKDFKKVSPKKITGTNIQGEYFEIASKDVMDYFYEEYKDDLVQPSKVHNKINKGNIK